ncbi:MAG: hypothetical protein JXA60_10140 [Candidatus Coatesbacteria bacterium]|nr:hypothetical protein [Candidatus Coatesbacteria bacterium]
MKDYIQGVLTEKYSSAWIIESSGIGWLIRIPPIYNLNAELIIGEQQKLYLYEQWTIAGNKMIYTLFGFLDINERDFFIEALKIPKLGASSFISSLIRPIDEIAYAILNNNILYLKSLPGIGANKAKSLIDDLQPYLRKNGIWTVSKKIDSEGGVYEASERDEIDNDLLAIMLQMQYSRSEALQRITLIRSRYPDERDIDKLVRLIFER